MDSEAVRYASAEGHPETMKSVPSPPWGRGCPSADGRVRGFSRQAESILGRACDPRFLGRLLETAKCRNSSVPAKREHRSLPFVPVDGANPKGFKLGKNWVAVGKDSLFVPAAHGRRPHGYCRPRRGRPVRPLQGRGFFDGPLPWVLSRWAGLLM
jgi:hypothetical protein